jgi:hypothetical protein
MAESSHTECAFSSLLSSFHDDWPSRGGWRGRDGLGARGLIARC